MCWVCDKNSLYANLGNGHAAGHAYLGAANQRGIGSPILLDGAFDFAPMDFVRLDVDGGKDTAGMIGTGHILAPPQVALIVVPDNVGGDTSSTATLTVDAAPIVSTTNTIGDQDFYRVTLVGGQSYEIGMNAKDGGPNLVPHGDCYIEIYDAAGNLIVSADGGASTVRNNINSGFDVLLSFTPDASGTYFVNARAYDQDPVNGTDGDFVGDYELFVRTPPPNAYKPYYDVDSPLYAIDWGTQVDRTSRNPDGQEGPRITGNEFTGVGSNPFGITGKNVITYYFAKQGEVFVNNDPLGDPINAALTTTVAFGMEGWEKNAFRTAMNNFEAVADVVYVEVNTRNEADFVFITYNGTPNAGVLGRMSPPNENAEGQAEFNRNGPGWTEAALVEGGFSFITLIHELGHGHGLAHPHDNGGRSGIMRGVEPETGPGGTPEPFNYTHGDFSLNQGIYTMMSYESGWEESPYGQASTQAPYGWDAGPMAFDIAALQDKYGVNEDWATGNDTYVLKDVNAKGTFYKAIWDAGGIDSMVYSGARDTIIDLRAATLQYEVGGGGFLSYAYGIHGGYTIANGVTIENAAAGSGNDIVTGNDVSNVLDGGAGDDMLSGGGGSDTLFGKVGTDNLSGGTDRDALFGGSEDDVLRGGDDGDWLYGEAGGDSLFGDAGNDELIGEAGRDALFGGLGDDGLRGGDDGDWLFGDDGSDSLFGENGDDELVGGVGRDVLFGGVGQDGLRGGDGDDSLFGGDGSDALFGGLGSDVFDGGSGNDVFVFDTALAGTPDTIVGFELGTDRILLDADVFTGLALGGLSNSAFVIGGQAQTADHRIIYNAATGALYFDADGTGSAAAIHFASVTAGLSLAAADISVIG